MEGHHVVGVGLLDGPCQRIPRSGALVAHDVAADHPDDVGLVLVAFAEEFAVGHGLSDRHPFNLRTPDAVHGDVDALRSREVNDVVEVLPVAIDARDGELGEVERRVVGLMPVYIKGGDGVEHLYLLHVVARFALARQVVFHFVAVESLRDEPRRVAQPEEGCAVLVHQIALVVRHLQPSVFPGLVDFRAQRGHGCHGQQ